MTLTGTYSRSLDDKHRLAIPKRLREEFSGKESTCLFIAPGTDRSLFLYAPQAFEELAVRLTVKPSSRANVRNYLRMFYARAEKVEIDNQAFRQPLIMPSSITIALSLIATRCRVVIPISESVLSIFGILIMVTFKLIMC